MTVCDSVTRTRHHHGINKGVTGDMDGACDITASRGAYHLTVLHIYSVLLGIFPRSSMLGVCSFVTWKELQHNKVSDGIMEKKSALKKTFRITGTNYFNEASSHENVLFILTTQALIVICSL